jgi:hypothetical protein
MPRSLNNLTPTPDRSVWKTRKGDTPADLWLGRRGVVDKGTRFVPQVVGSKTWGCKGGAESGFSLNHAATRVKRETPTPDRSAWRTR